MTTLDTIAGLLAMAERTTNEHEAAAFLTKAQTLATMTAVDLERARSHVRDRERRVQPVSRTLTVGDPGRRVNRHLISLFVAVAVANDVLADVARNSTYVIAYGMPSDIDTTEAVWASLAHQMVEAASRHLATGAWRGETYVAEVRAGGRGYARGRLEERPHTSQTARAAFYQGFIARVGARLAQARAAALRDHVPAQSGRTARDDRSDGALVLKAKADEVRLFHKEESRARGRWRGYAGAGLGDRGTSTAAGRDAATKARLRRSPEVGGRQTAIPSPR